MKEIYFRPKAGLLIPRDPLNEPGVNFPPEGDWTPHTPYIERRIQDGSGEKLDGPPPEAAAASTATAEPAAQPAAADYAGDINRAADRMRMAKPKG